MGKCNNTFSFIVNIFTHIRFDTLKNTSWKILIQNNNLQLVNKCLNSKENGKKRNSQRIQKILKFRNSRNSQKCKHSKCKKKKWLEAKNVLNDLVSFWEKWNSWQNETHDKLKTFLMFFPLLGIKIERVLKLNLLTF